MTEIMGERPSIVPIIRKFVPGAMSEHVWVNLKGKSCSFARPVISRVCDESSRPILLGFALHCRCIGVLHFEPIRRPERKKTAVVAVALPIVGRAVVVVVPGGIVTTVVGADVWIAKSAFRVINPQISARVG